MKIDHGPRVKLHFACPDMILREVLPDGRLVCEWMEDGKLKSAPFPLSGLKADWEHATVRASDSGGYQPRQRMTVIEHLSGHRVRCCWFEVGQYRSAEFSWDQLEPEAWMNSARFKAAS